MEKVIQIVYKKKDGKAFKANDEQWYNIAPFVAPYLEKATLNTDVTVVYEKKGTQNNVSKIIVSEVAESRAEKVVEGKTVNSPVPTKNVYYNNSDRTAQIQRGNALNAAADVSSGCSFNDVESATQFTLLLADRFLEWLRAE